MLRSEPYCFSELPHRVQYPGISNVTEYGQPPFFSSFKCWPEVCLQPVPPGSLMIRPTAFECTASIESLLPGFYSPIPQFIPTTLASTAQDPTTCACTTTPDIIPPATISTSISGTSASQTAVTPTYFDPDRDQLLLCNGPSHDGGCMTSNSSRQCVDIPSDARSLFLPNGVRSFKIGRYIECTLYNETNCNGEIVADQNWDEFQNTTSFQCVLQPCLDLSSLSIYSSATGYTMECFPGASSTTYSYSYLQSVSVYPTADIFSSTVLVTSSATTTSSTVNTALTSSTASTTSVSSMTTTSKKTTTTGGS